jgi:hypothetical protein
MNRYRILVLRHVLLAVLVLAGGVAARATSLDNYAVPWVARWGGGGAVSSANYAINGTVGQGAVGWTEGANRSVGAGYWYGIDVQHHFRLPLVLRSAS